MKILIVQITRLGDILCTIPVLSAIRRENQDAEIHVLARKRFSSALECTRFVDHIWALDSTKLLGRFINGSRQISDAVTDLAATVESLRAEKFDRVINLSFSPSSSFLTHLICGEKIPVSGYTRTSDFYLRVPDAASRYFRSQVGVDRHNRIHVADLFAWVCGVTLKASDWSTPLSKVQNSMRDGIVCHVGASHQAKTWPVARWVLYLNRVVNELRIPITLIGSGPERETAAQIKLQVDGIKNENSLIKNICGSTNMLGLARIVGEARLFVGADSGPLHVASLTETPSLNLSVGRVRFWETGPCAPTSRVLISVDPSHLSSDAVFQQTTEILHGKRSNGGYAEVTGQSAVRFRALPSSGARADAWPVAEWMYFGGPKPVFQGELARAVKQIQEVCSIALQQLQAFYKSPEKSEIVAILDRLDELLDVMRTHLDPVAPLIDWFKAEKENIPPGSRDEVFFQTTRCYYGLSAWCEKLVSLPAVQPIAKGQFHER